jgi:hypothetical protein
MTQSTTTATERGMPLHQLRLRRLHALVARHARTKWGRSYIESQLAEDAKSQCSCCPRFAGIVEESGDNAVIVADTQAALAAEMAAMFTSEITIRPVELVDLDTEQRQAAICDATVRFASEPSTEPERVKSGAQESSKREVLAKLLEAAREVVNCAGWDDLMQRWTFEGKELYDPDGVAAEALLSLSDCVNHFAALSELAEGEQEGVIDDLA